jgi:ArsR family transcriptional regulator
VDRRLDTTLFKALGDPTRAKLLACLMKCSRPCSVSELAECCVVDFSVVARHLALLAKAEIVQSQKQGRTVWYVVRASDLSARLRSLAAAIDECGSDCGSKSGSTTASLRSCCSPSTP